jgi:hypothetical protein
MNARILDVTPDEYHLLPAFSSTIAKTLIEKSPVHAKVLRGKKPTKGMDRGSVVHRLVLGKGKAFEVLNFGDYKTKAAQSARDAARANGRVPILGEDFEEASLAAESIRIQLADRGIDLDGESEVAVEWYEPSAHGPVQCRAMFDHVWFDRGIILDLKVTENAAPSFVERTAENLGYAIQQAAYRRALIALRPELAGREDFLFAFCEGEDPFAMNLTRPDGLFRELGDRRWSRAVASWAECLATDTWPAYGTGVNPLSAPVWALSKEEGVAA